MRTLEQLQDLLDDYHLSAVAKACGLHPNALYKFKRGESDPRYSTLEKLNNYFDKKEGLTSDENNG